MSTYVIAHLHTVELGADITRYLERIDATLAPFHGQFLVHGAPPEVLEGDWRGDLIVVAFPDRQLASAWYASAAYQNIIRLRTDNSEGDVILVDGVSPEHRATDILG